MTATARTDRERRLPGDVDMWVMILGDLFFFGCYFVVYMVFRALSKDEFTAAQSHLNTGVGALNTVVLLTSSLLAALAVIAVREGAVRRARLLLTATGACGTLFAVIKAGEWAAEIGRGRTIGSEFFSFYYGLTGIHLAHVALGLLFLGVSLRELRPAGRRRAAFVEQGVLFWHMVDLLWIVIFALLYLMR